MITDHPTATAVDTVLGGFAPATLELLASRQLMRRTDTKFVVSAASIPAILGSIARDYAVVGAGTSKIASYLNLYFDTPDLRCFHDHRRGRRIRNKIRIRHYPDRELAYLEVKTRRNELYTVKERIAIPYGTRALDDRMRVFLRERCPFADELVPGISIDYRRISLAGLAIDERVTIDLGVAVDDRRGASAALEQIAIVEVKQPAIALDTPMMRALRGRGLHTCSMSKYVTAITLTSDLRCSRLRPTLRELERIRP